MHRHALGLTNNNAQGQYYLTDLIEAVSRERGDIRTVTTTVSDPEYDLLCSDVTQPMDLAFWRDCWHPRAACCFRKIWRWKKRRERLWRTVPPAQVASIARQLGDLMSAAAKEKLGIRSRPAHRHRHFGRAIAHRLHAPGHGAVLRPGVANAHRGGDAQGEEQIVVLLQSADDGRIHLFPINPKYRESINFVPSDNESMYPGEDVSDLHTYEEFGTRMSESLLLSLGYFSEDELEARRKKGLPLPPPSLWVGSNMRRPFALVGNAIASLRTLRSGTLGRKDPRTPGTG